jgi:hypothetical protein
MTFWKLSCLLKPCVFKELDNGQRPKEEECQRVVNHHQSPKELNSEGYLAQYYEKLDGT